jgi:glycine dehydrogenase
MRRAVAPRRSGTAAMTSMQTSSKADLSAHAQPGPLDPLDTFARRHLGPTPAEEREMLATLGCASMEQLIDSAIPAGIRLGRGLEIADPTNAQGFPVRGESETLAALQRLADRNQVWRSYIGMGYHDTITPPVILRNILENPAWYGV